VLKCLGVVPVGIVATDRRSLPLRALGLHELIQRSSELTEPARWISTAGISPTGVQVLVIGVVFLLQRFSVGLPFSGMPAGALRCWIDEASGLHLLLLALRRCGDHFLEVESASPSLASYVVALTQVQARPPARS